MDEDADDDDSGGEAWADILARRSPEGRAVVDALQRAEAAALAFQKLLMTALTEGRDGAEEYADFETATGEVDRMRREVYRMARQ